MNRRAEDRFADILTAIERVLSYRDSLSAEDAAISGMAYDAVLRNLAVIGEAVRALPDDFKASRAHVPWPAIAGMRNIVIHEYFRVDRDVILDIIDTHLSALAESLHKDPG